MPPYKWNKLNLTAAEKKSCSAYDRTQPLIYIVSVSLLLPPNINTHTDILLASDLLGTDRYDFLPFTLFIFHFALVEFLLVHRQTENFPQIV